MAFCSNCGTETPGAFCPNCGAPAGAPASSPAGPNPGASPAYGAGAPFSPAASGLTDNVASALCYFPFAIGIIISIVFLVVAPYSQNKTIRFNAFQSLLIHLAWVVLVMVLAIIGGMLHVVGMVGLGLLYPLLGLATFILLLYLAYSSYTNKTVVLPIVGEFAKKQA